MFKLKPNTLQNRASQNRAAESTIQDIWNLLKDLQQKFAVTDRRLESIEKSNNRMPQKHHLES